LKTDLPKTDKDWWLLDHKVRSECH